MKVLDYIPGFRSKNNTKMMMATLYYISTIVFVLLENTFAFIGFSVTFIPFIIFPSIYLINNYGDGEEQKINLRLLRIGSLIFDIYLIRLGYILYKSINTLDLALFAGFNLNFIETIIAIALILWGIAATILSIMKMIENDKDKGKLNNLSNVLIHNIGIVFIMLVFLFKNYILVYAFK